MFLCFYVSKFSFFYSRAKSLLLPRSPQEGNRFDRESTRSWVAGINQDLESRGQVAEGLYVLQMCDRQRNAKNVLQTGKTTNRLIKD